MVWHYAPALGVLLCGGDILVILGLTDGGGDEQERNQPIIRGSRRSLRRGRGETTTVISGCFLGRVFGTNPMF